MIPSGDMKKICAVALLITLLSGCGGSRAESTPVPTAAPTAAPTTAPTPAPTEAPTPAPTEAPTATPTAAPTETPAPTPAPTETPEPGPTATPVAPGVYTYESPKGRWKLQLRDDGLFTLTDPEGTPHTGEGWLTGGDGLVTCGPTDIYFEDFAFDGGCSRWEITGKTCRPVERAS